MRVIDILAAVTYGARFRELRRRLSLEQDDVAERLFGSKKQQGNVAAIEAMAGRVPRAETVVKHAAALECAVSELVGPVTDTWLDRARSGEFDRPARATRGSPAGRSAAAKTSAR